MPIESIESIGHCLGLPPRPSPKKLEYWVEFGRQRFEKCQPIKDIIQEIAVLAYVEGHSKGAKNQLERIVAWIMTSMPRIDEQHKITDRLLAAFDPKPPDPKREALDILTGEAKLIAPREIGRILTKEELEKVILALKSIPDQQ